MFCGAFVIHGYTVIVTKCTSYDIDSAIVITVPGKEELFPTVVLLKLSRHVNIESCLCTAALGVSDHDISM